MGAEEFIPREAKSLTALGKAAQSCQGCDLYAEATQTVFGQGSPKARIVMVGEQPGDVEDKEGFPFVGPAGQLLARAMGDAGIPPEEVYLTNAVKHFRFRREGKRRIHQTPTRTEIVACRPWLVAEFGRLSADTVVVLGSIAAQALLGPSFRVTKSRGEPMPWPESAEHPEDFGRMHGQVIATVHPSAVLRADDRQAAYAAFVKDLKIARLTAKSAG